MAIAQDQPQQAQQQQKVSCFGPWQRMLWAFPTALAVIGFALLVSGIVTTTSCKAHSIFDFPRRLPRDCSHEPGQVRIYIGAGFISGSILLFIVMSFFLCTCAGNYLYSSTTVYPVSTTTVTTSTGVGTTVMQVPMYPQHTQANTMVISQWQPPQVQYVQQQQYVVPQQYIQQQQQAQYVQAQQYMPHVAAAAAAVQQQQQQQQQYYSQPQSVYQSQQQQPSHSQLQPQPYSSPPPLTPPSLAQQQSPPPQQQLQPVPPLSPPHLTQHRPDAEQYEPLPSAPAAAPAGKGADLL